MHVSKVARHPPDLCKAGLCTDLCTARPEAQDHHGRAMLACPEGDTLSPSTLLSQRSMRDGSPNSTMLSHSEAGGFLGKANVVVCSQQREGWYDVCRVAFQC